jgi:hypothetical protein
LCYLQKQLTQLDTKIENAQRTFVIGDKWLYYKIYCGVKTADMLLLEVIKSLTEQLIEEKIIDRWFFIRYSDPEPHVRFRVQFIDIKNIGASTINLNKELKASYSNYSNNYVDLFAHGNDIYTALPNNKHNFNGGTSLASAITSRVTALLFSYYPNLTASQVKHILMDSGLEYDIEVSTPTKDDKNKMTPFNQLSKSGKVLNAYNAFIMADSISRSN